MVNGTLSSFGGLCIKAATKGLLFAMLVGTLGINRAQAQPTRPAPLPLQPGFQQIGASETTFGFFGYPAPPCAAAETEARQNAKDACTAFGRDVEFGNPECQTTYTANWLPAPPCATTCIVQCNYRCVDKKKDDANSTSNVQGIKADGTGRDASGVNSADVDSDGLLNALVQREQEYLQSVVGD